MNEKTIAQSTKWSAITEFLAKIIAPLINIILARLLVPEVFGLVASFTLVTTFAEVFTDAGFQKYLVQHEFENDTDREQCTNVAFWTNLGFSCLFWLVICIFRDSIAALVGSPGHGIEIAVIGFQIPLVAFSSIQTALFRRDFRFKQLLPIRLTVSLVPLVVTVPLAFFLKNSWALIIGTLTKEVVNACFLTYKSTWKPRLYYSFKKLKDMLGNCLWMLGDSLMIWMTSYAGTLIVSHSLDAHYLGLYKTGISTVTPYINLIYSMTYPVLFAALSRTQNDKKEFDRIFLFYQKYASYIAVPIGFAIFVYRDAVTMILLGKNWMEVSILVGIVGLAMPFCIITAQYNSDYFRAMGRPYIAFIVQAIYLASMITGLLIGVSQSFTTLCIIRGCLYFVYAVVSIAMLDIVFKVHFWHTLKNLLPSLLGAVALTAVGILLKDFFGGAIWWQIISGVIAVIAYGCVILIIPSSRKDLLQTKVAGKIFAKLHWKV